MPKKLLFAAVVTAAVFALAEATVAVLWDPPPPGDPFVGFSSATPLLVLQEHADTDVEIGPKENAGQLKQTRFRINPRKRVWFNDQSFPETKEEGTYRIVCLGGSTTFGRPFDDSTSFCGWLRQLLPMIDRERKWEVLNAGGISYASYRVAKVMEEFAGHDVDLFILYTGHNEFLEQRTYGELMGASELPRHLSTWMSKTNLGSFVQFQFDRSAQSRARVTKQEMSDDVDEMLNHSIGPANYHRDPAWARGVAKHFRFNLFRMKAIARSAGAKFVVVTPVSNLKDCSPFKGEFSEGIDAKTKKQMVQRLASARDALKRGDASRAAEILDSLKESDDSNAMVEFLLGKALLELNRPDEAHDCFQRAIDLDVCPLRATSTLKAHVRELMEDEFVIGVDFETHLRSVTQKTLSHTCFGKESFLDHVHPTVDVHREIAVTITKALADNAIISRVADAEVVRLANERVQAGLNRNSQGIAFRNLAKVMHWAGRIDEAKHHAEDALRLLPDDAESRFLLADCLDKSGESEEAIRQYELLFEAGGFARAYQPFGELLASQGHYEAAKAYLIEAIFLSQGDAQRSAYESLGRLHQYLGEDDLAADCFKNAKQIP